ncbi:hypothetical protein [Streptomyces coeruleorubidus]|uniref:Uncharacterized protein n=1 Tax=Streptomyces coeruleorubidus TaxID=116188 RepID=A0ABZ0KMF7_STRC4|nr:MULTISPECIES: hypothetical protein [Streptomyces]WOT38789.1 hypothetical protein R5U08_33595 [Streptomyces coeruleorubidus]GGU45690.1 hypothetical protein GCM10010244_84420 [Streptomyces bellus]
MLLDYHVWSGDPGIAATKTFPDHASCGVERALRGLRGDRLEERHEPNGNDDRRHFGGLRDPLAPRHGSG